MSQRPFEKRPRFFRCTWCRRNFYALQYRHPDAPYLNFQTEICKTCLEAVHSDPSEHGFEEQRSLTRTVWTDPGVEIPSEFEGSPGLFTK